MKRDILLLGDPRLYDISTEVTPEELGGMPALVRDLRDTLLAFRETYCAGRGIAAPQIAVPKRVVYMLTDHETVLINPTLTFPDDETVDLLDDCMSFPNLLVKVSRRKRCRVTYRDLEWREQTLSLEGSLSELIQHEYDHLNGILATMRAVDVKALICKGALNIPG